MTFLFINMKKILELTQLVKKDNQAVNHHWKLELEIAEYPTILKRGVCKYDCLTIRGDKADKDLIFAYKMIENNWIRN